MTELKPTQSSRWQSRVLWTAPWVLYLVLVGVTIVAAGFSGRGLWWLRPLVKDEVLRVLAAVLVLFWLIARSIIAAKSKSWILVVLGTLAELPVAFVVYLFWVFGMIGGPINPG